MNLQQAGATGALVGLFTMIDYILMKKINVESLISMVNIVI